LDRIKINVVSILGHWIIYIFCRTLRWESVNRQTLMRVHDSGKRLIMAFWHGRIFMATYFFRNRGIVVMTSQNRDGEYIAGVIRRFGYGVARGSSTRGSHSATSEALRALREGKDVGITMDGPRGPRYVAKRGAAFLSRKTGNPVLPFHIAVEKKWVMNSWDHFQIPKPFSRAIVLIGEPIYVDPGCDREDIEAVEARIQGSLDELLKQGDRWWNGEPDRS
jgi:lysophospholipid acyltransferase (LPLAT)-like uncharacterized protein